MPDQQQLPANSQSHNSSIITPTNQSHNQTESSLAIAATDLMIDEQNLHKTVITNSSLHIKSVSLADDDYFQCIVGTADTTHRTIKSKIIKLTVLDPPSKLTIAISKDEQQDASTTFLSLQVSGSVKTHYNDA